MHNTCKSGCDNTIVWITYGKSNKRKKVSTVKAQPLKMVSLQVRPSEHNFHATSSI